MNTRNENAIPKRNASGLFECPTCGECYTTISEAEGCKNQYLPNKPMCSDESHPELRPELHPKPANFWQLFEMTEDGSGEVPCNSMPQAYPQPDDLVPALIEILASRELLCETELPCPIHIRPVSFTIAMAAVTLFKNAMTILHIQLATSWSNETMKEIEKAAACIHIETSPLPSGSRDSTAVAPLDQAKLLLDDDQTADEDLWGETNADE